MHTMSQVISHLTTGESNSVSKGRKTQNFNATICDLHLTQALFNLHTHSQGSTWQECQAKEEAPYLGASLQLLRFIHSTLNG